MEKKRVVDLCCGVGGASKGYADAGMEVVCAVDIEHQPDYPYQGVLIKSDVVEFLRLWAEGRHGVNADLIHISPPCQFDAAITRGTNKHLRHTYPNLYPQVKTYLERLGIPYVIENPAARPDVVLCGEMFGLRVIRHRKFELRGWSAVQPPEPKHRGRVKGMRHGVWYEGYYYAVYGCGGGKGTVPEWQDAMDIHWTDRRKSIAEAIPPAYTRWIGEQFLAPDVDASRLTLEEALAEAHTEWRTGEPAVVRIRYVGGTTEECRNIPTGEIAVGIYAEACGNDRVMKAELVHGDGTVAALYAPAEPHHPLDPGA